MDTFTAYIPIDRQLALLQSEELPTLSYGSALFADISGFTPLTEKLAHLFGARRGAEELSIHLNSVYEALISQVDYFGGTVISFAGDSITCWFDAKQGSPALRATAAAFSMQTMMTAVADITLINGQTIPLAMKVAIATGPTRRFLVGDPAIQRLDTLAGRTVERLALAEKLAKPSQILVDQQTVADLGHHAQIANWQEDAQTHTVFARLTDLTTAVPPCPWPPVPDHALPIAQTRPWLLTAVAEREQTGQKQFLTELRPAVALFLRFTGINYEEDNDAGAKLHQFVCQVQNILAQYGGTLLQLTIGDKGSYLYASFGAPIAHEDDVLRATNAAQALQALTDSPTTAVSRCQIGMSRGVMRAGSYGSRIRCTYGVLGDHVNLAARLMEKALPGQILISDALEPLLRRQFQVELVARLHLKGKQEPVAAYTVLNRRPQDSFLQAQEYSIPLVGRHQELEQINQKLTLARQGQGQIVGIQAEAGMGKSRLIAEIIRLHHPQHLLFLGESQSYGTNIPYLSWLPIWHSFFDLDPNTSLTEQTDILQTQLNRWAPERIDALPLLAAMLGLPLADTPFTHSLEPELRRSVLEAILLDCLQHRAQQARQDNIVLIFILDDVHWLDPVSHDLLETLGRAITHLPILFVLAYRPPQFARLQKVRVESLPHYTAVPLTELSLPEAEQLIRTRLQLLFPQGTTAVPKALVQQIASRAQGNPFYIEELVNYLHARGLDLADPTTFTNLDLPASLHSLILSRIDQLSETQKLTLKIASIIGRLFRFNWLLGYYPNLGHLEQVRANLLELERLDITPIDQPEPEMVYMFKHIVTQEVTYSSLPYATRAILHEQLAKYIEQLDANRFVDLLAFHYGRSNNQAKKIEFWQKAGLAAAARFANEEAVDYLSRALELIPPSQPQHRYDLLLQREQLFNLQGDHQHQKEDLASLRHLTRLLSDHQKQAEVALRHARFAEITSDYEEACNAAQKALAMSQLAHRTDLEASAYLQWGRALFRQTDYKKAQRCLQRAHTLAEKASQTDLAADCLMNLGNVSWAQGDYQQARTQYSQALQGKKQAANGRGESILLNNLGVVAYSQSDYETAERHYKAALDLMRVFGDRRNESFVLGNLGLVAAHLGHYHLAETYQQQSLRLRQQTADRYGENLARMNLGTIALYQGDYSAAQAHYEQALRQYQIDNNLQSQAEIFAYLALLHYQLHAHTTAHEFAQAAVNITDSIGLRSEAVLALRNRGHIAAAQQDWGSAQADYKRALALCYEIGNENWAQEVIAGLARIAHAQADLPTAVAHVEGILRHLQISNVHGTDEPLRIYLTCVQVLQAANDRRAAPLLTSAYQLLHERATSIPDLTLRQKYLTAVPHHQTVQQLYHHQMSLTAENG